MKTTQPPQTCGPLITSHRKQTTRFKEIKIQSTQTRGRRSFLKVSLKLKPFFSICGHSIATSGYLRYEFTGLSRFLKIRLSRKPELLNRMQQGCLGL